MNVTITVNRNVLCNRNWPYDCNGNGRNIGAATINKFNNLEPDCDVNLSGENGMFRLRCSSSSYSEQLSSLFHKPANLTVKP